MNPNQMINHNANIASSPKSLPVAELQPVQQQYENLVTAMNTLRGQIDILDERLGYVSQVATPKDSDGPEDMPSLSPMAHNLYCVASDVNRLISRVSGIIGRLEI